MQVKLARTYLLGEGMVHKEVSTKQNVHVAKYFWNSPYSKQTQI